MRSIFVKAIVFVFTINWIVSDGARIFGVFSVPSISHQVAFRPLMKELAKRGHKVTVLTTDPEFKDTIPPENFTEIDVHDISYGLWKNGFVKLVNGKADDFQAMAAIADLQSEITEYQFNKTEFKEILYGREKIDLVIAEVWSTVAIAVGVWLKAPVVQISSLPGLRLIYERYGVPTHPLIYPEFNRKRINNVSLFGKFQEIYHGEKFNSMHKSAIENERKLIQKVFGDNMISVNELIKVPELLLLNVHPIWVQNRPVPPNVIFIGGIHQNPKKDLPIDLKYYLDSTSNGVIYMSFGTNVDTKVLDPVRIKIFCDVFRQLPYNVLWKWNDDTLPEKPDNVKIAKWLPQSDLLRHPKIKVFITQAGLQSTDEAITAAVPLIAFPMLGDQFYNAEMYEHLKIGVRMDFTTVTESSLLETIIRVINDKSYQNNIRRLNSTMNDQPQTSLERAVWWTEYVLRHGGAKHLRSPMADVSWTEFFILDVVFVVLGILAIVLACIIYLIHKVLRTISKSSKVKKT